MKHHYQILVWIYLFLQCELSYSQTIIDESIKWDTLVVLHQIPMGKYPKIWIKDDSKSMVTESGGYVYRGYYYFEQNCFDEGLKGYIMCQKTDTLDFASDSSIVTDWGKSSIIFERDKKQQLERKDILGKITSKIDEVISSKEVYFNEDGLKDLIVLRKITTTSYLNKDEEETYFDCTVYLKRGNNYELSLRTAYDKLPHTICISKFKIQGMSLIIAFDLSRWVENSYQLEILKMKVEP